mgnify:CR=1 FL=1
MTEKRQRMISAMKYILLVIIVGYLVILMLYASGSKRTFSEVSKAVSSVLDSKELVQMDAQEKLWTEQCRLQGCFVLFFSVQYFSSGSSGDTGEK